MDEKGRITPPWYRLIVALVQRTSGTPGRVTPLPSDPLQIGLFDFSGGGSAGGGESFSLESPKEQTIFPLWLEADKKHNTVAQIWDLSRPNSLPPGPIQFLPDSPLPAAPEDVTPTGSPFLYSPGFDGFVVVFGAGVSQIEISRDGGGTLYDTGLTSGSFPLSLADSIIITYAVAPPVTFVRR